MLPWLSKRPSLQRKRILTGKKGKTYRSQFSDLCWMPNSVSKGFSPAMGMSSSRHLQPCPISQGVLVGSPLLWPGYVLICNKGKLTLKDAQFVGYRWELDLSLESFQAEAKIFAGWPWCRLVNFVDKWLCRHFWHSEKNSRPKTTQAKKTQANNSKTQYFANYKHFFFSPKSSIFNRFALN